MQSLINLMKKREDILIDLREKFSISRAVLYKIDGTISAISENNRQLAHLPLLLKILRDLKMDILEK